MSKWNIKWKPTKGLKARSSHSEWFKSDEQTFVKLLKYDSGYKASVNISGIFIINAVKLQYHFFFFQSLLFLNNIFIYKYSQFS